MKRTRNVLMLAALVTLSIFMSCGGGGGGNSETDGEKLVNALVDGTWTVNTTSTNVNATGTFDESSFTITFAKTATGASFSLGGDGLTTYVSGGSFSVDDDTNITDEAVTVVDSTLELTNPNVSVNSAQTTVTITFGVEEKSARLVGIGNYELVFDI